MSRPLRFLHVTTFYPPYSFGGDAIYVARLANALADDGHSVDVVHCVDSYLALARKPPPSSDEFRHPRVAVHPLRSGLGILSPLLSHQTGRPYLKLAALNRLSAEKQFDVVNFHNISLFGPGVFELTPSHDRAIKLYTGIEYWLVCPTHVLWKFNSRACEGPQCLRCVIRARRPPQLWRYTGLLERESRKIDQFVVPSRFSMEMHRQRGFAGALEHLPLFAEDAPGTDKDAPRLYQRPYFLFVGRLERLKGVDTLIAAWEQFHEADLVIAGEGGEGARLRAQAASNPCIRFLGSVSSRALGTLYSQAVACVVPSLAYETFALVVVEAFAHRTPVIAHDLGAPRELVEESGGGRVYRSVEELRKVLREFVGAPELREQLAANGYRAFRERWSRRAHLDRYYDLIRRTALRKFGVLPWESGTLPGDSEKDFAAR